MEQIAQARALVEQGTVERLMAPCLIGSPHSRCKNYDANRSALGRVQVLQNDSKSLSDADADGRDAPPLTGLDEAFRQRREYPSAGGAQWMPDCDGTALGVDDGRIMQTGVE